MHPVMAQTQKDQQMPPRSSEPDNETNHPTETMQKDDEILARYEEMFQTRYTSDDPAYMPYMNKEMDPPPIVTNYHVRRPRTSWNDNAQGQRNNLDRGYKRRYDDRDWQGNIDQSKRRFPDGVYDHQRRGWGHQGQRGQYSNQRWDHHPRQNWSQWDRPGQGSRPQRGQHARQYDDRHRGGHSSSYQESNEPEWT